MDISTRGGELVRADLLKYPLVKNQPDVPVRLFSPTAAASMSRAPVCARRTSVPSRLTSRCFAARRTNIG